MNIIVYICKRQWQSFCMVNNFHNNIHSTLNAEKPTDWEHFFRKFLRLSFMNTYSNDLQLQVKTRYVWRENIFLSSEDVRQVILTSWPMDSDHKLSCDKQRSKSCEVQKKKRPWGKLQSWKDRQRDEQTWNVW